jgi:predicted Zn-dependent protease
MRRNTIWRLIALAIVPIFAIITFSQNNVSAEEKISITAEAQIKQVDPYYQQVRADMEGALGRIGEDYYAVYRMVERIARANRLDEQPWRIRVSSQDEVNAFASNMNMLTFEGGLLEQLSGDTSAIACVVGHEMAHHTQGHIPEKVELGTRMNTLQEEALQEAREEVEAAGQRRNIFGTIINVVSGVAGRSSSGSGRIASGVAGQVLQGMNQEQTNQAVARAEEIYTARIAELNSEYSVVQRNNESEADAVGYEYIVSAGFEPVGCVRAMEALNRTETSQLPGISHPKPEDRIAALSTLNTPATNQPLIARGEANLSQSPNPLEYDVSRDGTSIRVESRFGSRDIDDGFPQ